MVKEVPGYKTFAGANKTLEKVKAKWEAATTSHCCIFVHQRPDNVYIVVFVVGSKDIQIGINISMTEKIYAMNF